MPDLLPLTLTRHNRQALVRHADHDSNENQGCSASDKEQPLSDERDQRDESSEAKSESETSNENCVHVM